VSSSNALQIERERTPASTATVLSLKHDCPKGQTNITMIRLITALCKTLLEFVNDEQIFQDASDGYIHYDNDCPRCGTIGKLDSYGGYFRWLISRWKRKGVSRRIWIRRFECKSCCATHALLPDILTPYSQYSLHFKLTVLIAYFERDCTVESLCNEFEIAISTLYEWLKRIASHKELMIGVLLSKRTPVLDFLRTLIGSDDLSDTLNRFFHKYGFSFLQRTSAIATLSNPP
jgi:transposase-like protein